MDSAIITKSLSTFSAPPYMIVDYFYAMGSDSTSFISLELPAKDPAGTLTGKSYAIDLANFSISCDSGDFDIKVLSKGDEIYENTIYEVLAYEGSNKSELDVFDRLIIRNKDDTVSNKLYVQIINNGGAVT